MITLLHGTDILASRNELNRMKSSLIGSELRVIDGKTVDENNLIQTLQSNSLFGNDVTVVIEQLLSGLGKKIKVADSLCRIIQKSAEGGTVILLWENKEIGKTLIAKLGVPARIKLYNIPTLIFTFLDNLRPRNIQFLLDTYEKLVQKDAAELVHVMSTRRLRQLLMIAGGGQPEGVQGWQISRLTSQAKYFSMEQLLVLYKKLIDIEFSIKTGTSPFDFRKQMELFIVEI